MKYSSEDFVNLDEIHALADVLTPIGPALYTVLAEARSDLETRYPDDLFWPHQNRQNLSRLVNQRTARIWEQYGSDDWTLFDRSGFLHLRENETGVKLILRKVDPLTHGVPQSNATRASRAYFSQSQCIPKGQLQAVDPGLFDEGKLIPDLHDIGLVCTWDEMTDGGVSIVVYKTEGPGRYGEKNHYLFKFPLFDSVRGDEQYEFIPLQEDQENLLPNLLADQTDVEDVDNTDSSSSEKNENEDAGMNSDNKGNEAN